MTTEQETSDEATEAAVEKSPFADVRRVDLLQFGTAAQAMRDGVDQFIDDIRAELLRQGLAEYREQGMKPSWNAGKTGSISFTIPDNKMAVTDREAFAAWVAEHRPTEVVDSLRVAEQNAARAYEVLQAAGIPCELDRAPRGAWMTNFLKMLEVDVAATCPPDCDDQDDEGVCATHAPVVSWVDPSTGLTVEGVGEVAGGNPYVTLRPNKATKTTLAEAVKNDLMSRIGGPTTAAGTAVAELVAKSGRDRNEKR